MSSSNMINPANYYNPFAKYNYVSKTRGFYVPRDTQSMVLQNQCKEKSASIYSDNYDAEADLMQAMSDNQTEDGSHIFSFINKLFKKV